METYEAVSDEEERQANRTGNVVVKAMWGDGESDDTPSKHNKYAGKEVSRVNMSSDLADKIGIGMEKSE